MDTVKDTALFFSKFLRHGFVIASAVPSSVWLSRAALTDIPWNETHVLLELGAGTGAITQEILKRAPQECRILCVERDPDFVRVLKKRFGSSSQLEIIEGDVLDIERILAERSIVSVDYIVSGLSVPTFKKEAQEAFFTAIRRILKPGGGYNQITEIPLVFQKFYASHFESVRFIFEPRNIPPGGIYVCRGICS